MMNTLAIYQELSGTLGNDAAMKIAAVMGKIYEELKNSVTKDEFKDLRNIVTELAEAQKRTEIKVEELADAQKRTEINIEKLAEVQKRFEIRTDENFKSLRDQIAALAAVGGFTMKGLFGPPFMVCWGKCPELPSKKAIMAAVRSM